MYCDEWDERFLPSRLHGSGSMRFYDVLLGKDLEEKWIHGRVSEIIWAKGQAGDIWPRVGQKESPINPDSFYLISGEIDNLTITLEKIEEVNDKLIERVLFGVKA
jgi:hypothetical protein